MRYRLYRLIRVVRHRLGLHDWRERGMRGANDGIHAPAHLYCDWCGATREIIGYREERD